MLPRCGSDAEYTQHISASAGHEHPSRAEGSTGSRSAAPVAPLAGTGSSFDYGSPANLVRAAPRRAPARSRPRVMQARPSGPTSVPAAAAAAAPLAQLSHRDVGVPEVAPLLREVRSACAAVSIMS